MGKEMEPLFETPISGVKDVSAHDFINAFSQHLKRQGKIEIPKWVDYVKTGHAKELAPVDPDWLYVRAAAIARRLYIRSGAGVGGLSKGFGSRANNGTCKEHKSFASRKVIRYLLQQMEEIGIMENHPAKGRRLTDEGRRELD